MNDLSMKEKAMIATLLVTVMFGALVWGWFTKGAPAWKKAKTDYDKEVATYSEECKLIAEEDRWNEDYDREKAAMPSVKPDESSDLRWMSKLQEIAEKHDITLGAVKPPDKELGDGDVLERRIVVNGWSGEIESLVKFMHEMENTDEGMFAFSDISIQPNKTGLKGSFTVNCAYILKDPAKDSEEEK